MRTHHFVLAIAAVLCLLGGELAAQQDDNRFYDYYRYGLLAQADGETVPRTHPQPPEAEEGVTYTPRADEEPRAVEQEEDGRASFWIGASAAAWYGLFEFDGEFQGDTIDFVEGLGYDDEEIIPAAEVYLVSRYVSLYVDGFWVEYEGSTRLDRTFTIFNREFAISSQVESRLEIQSARLLLELKPLSFEVFEIGVVAGGRYARFEFELEEEGLIGVDGTSELEGGSPLVGGVVRFFADDYLEVMVRASGMEAEYGDYEGRLLEIEGGIAFYPFKYLGIRLDYKYIELFLKEADDDDGDLAGKIRLHGPFLGVHLRF